MHDKTTTTAVKQHLKVKDTEKDVGLKSLHYCQHAKNLLNSYTHSYSKADFTVL